MLLNVGIPVAFVEFKHHHTKSLFLGSAQFISLSWTAMKCELPLFLVIYWPESQHAFMYPVNQWAAPWFLPGSRRLTYQGYGAFEHQIRQHDDMSEIYRFGNDPWPEHYSVPLIYGGNLYTGMPHISLEEAVKAEYR